MWMDGYGGSGVVMPYRRASPITVCSPSAIPSLMVARLRDRYSPSRIGIRPSVVSSSSLGCHGVESSWRTGGVGGGAFSIAGAGGPERTGAEYTKGVEVHAGCHTDSMAQ